MSVRGVVRRGAALGAASVLAGVGLVGLTALPAHADSFSVATEAELAAAITAANGSAGPDVITITADIDLLVGNLPWIETDLEVVGNGFTLDGTGTYGTLAVDSGGFTVSISHLTVVNAVGFGIEAYDADLSLDAVTVTGSGDGGLYAEESSVTITDSHLDGNGGSGANFFGGAASVLRVNGSSFDGNDDYGLYADALGAAQVELVDATARGNGDAGFLLSAEDDTVLTAEVLTVEDNGGHGVSVNARSNAVVELSMLVLGGNEGDNLNVDARGSASVSISGATATGSLEDDGMDLELYDDARLVASGLVASGNAESGIEVAVENNATADISDSLAQGNTDHGVDLYADSDGTVVLSRVDSVGNGDDGYDVSMYGDASITVLESTIADNENAGVDLGVESDGAFALDSSTVSGNARIGINAELYSGAFGLSVLSSTISGNGGADVCVGGIYAGGSGDDSAARFELLHSTVYANTSRSGCPQVAVAGIESAVVSHSIIAGTDWDIARSGEPDLTVEWSIIESPDAALVPMLESGSNQLEVDPGLEPLADNGGPTWTHLLISTSPAVDAGNPSITGEPGADQRGEDRIRGSAIDIGAVEIPHVLPATGADSTGPLTAGLALLVAGFLAFGLHRRVIAR